LKKKLSQRKDEEDSFLDNLKCNKTVFLHAPIFKMKYSHRYPNLLSVCGEDGNLAIIDVNSDYINTRNNNGVYNNNVDSETEILPKFNSGIHDNAIYGLSWCDSDTKIITSSADTLSKISNFTQDKFGLCELELVGHTKRIKSNAQNIFNENIIATCGGDGIIFIWDKRSNNKRFCNQKCVNYRNNISHIHPIGAFRNVYKDLVLRKKYSQNLGILNWEVHNTFTEVDFYDSNLIVSTETNNDDLKFWELRNMLTNELEYFFNTEKKITKKELIKKLDAKNYLSSISPYSHLYIKYNIYKQKNRLSSKFNSNENSLFPSLFFFSSLSNNNNQYHESVKNKNKKKNNNINDNKNQTIIDDYLKKMKNNFETKMTIEKDLNHENTDISSINYDYTGNIYNDENNSEMEIYYREKIKESKKKQGIKGLTSLNINRNEGLILINSISGSQYIYDNLFLDEKEPLELKSNSSSLYVKSVLSTSGRYVLSGSKGPEMIIWDLNKKNKDGQIKKIEFSNVHPRDVNAVDWGRNHNNFISSGCDSGVVAIWDVNK
jgi:WD40 repeat protein